MNDELVTCTYCGREWDGNAQCNCFGMMYESSDDLFPINDDSPITMVDVSTQTKRNRWGPTKLEIAQKAVDKKFNKIINIQIILS